MKWPIPTRILSNGEFNPPPQSEKQKLVEGALLALADRFRKPHGLCRRAFLKSLCGLAAGFLAMNQVYGSLFDVEETEAADPAYAREKAQVLRNQFIFDDQLHFVHDDYQFEGLLDLRTYAGKHWNPGLQGEKRSFKKIQFQNFLKEIFLQSDTKIGLLSGAPSDVPKNWFLTNNQLAEARRIINAVAGSNRMLCHSIITPGQEGWLKEIDRSISLLRPDAWKGYTVGDPLSNSRYPYRLDDESLMYPAYEKMLKAGIRNVCIHKGLLPNDYLTSFENWKYATVDDVGKAARDWPDLNFVIYHAALKPLNDYPAAHLERFEATGRIDWVSDLAEIPKRFGVDNVYADIGTSFASCAVAHPRHAAGLLGILIKGLGFEKVLWGTDSVWYGSPQWQIEAFRRLEIPKDMQDRYGFSALGGANSITKRAILGMNGARLYGLDLKTLAQSTMCDRLASLKRKQDQRLHEGQSISSAPEGNVAA